MCKPCIASFEVEVFEHREDAVIEEFAADGGRGCPKMSLCGVVEQRKTMTFRLIDRKKRDGAQVRAIIHFDQQTIELGVEMVENVPYNYEISWAGNETGVGLLQLDFDGVQIPESPVKYWMRKSDSLWMIDVDEFQFDDPVAVIGQ